MVPVLVLLFRVDLRYAIWASLISVIQRDYLADAEITARIGIGIGMADGLGLPMSKRMSYCPAWRG